MGSVGCLAKGDIFFWQNILKNRSKYRGDILEQSVVCTVLISAIIIEIYRKNIPTSYIIPYKKLASPLIPVCLKKSHMKRNGNKRHRKTLITVNARCKQTAQLTAKRLRSGIRIRIPLTCLKRVMLWLKRIQNFTNPQLQKLVTSKALSPGF